jgi:hypothetical protein
MRHPPVGTFRSCRNRPGLDTVSLPHRGYVIGGNMPLLHLVLVLVVVGVLLWLVNNYIPMDGKIKSILNAVVVIGVVIWLLQAFGLLETLENFRIGK